MNIQYENQIPFQSNRLSKNKLFFWEKTSEKISFSESTMFSYGLTLNLVENSQKNFLIILGAFCISVQYRKAIFNEFPLSRHDHPKLCFERGN